ncbi:MAG: sterol desaturase family protein [Pseudomonadota bacterium]
MSAQPHNTSGDYQPDHIIKLPAIFAWPPKLIAALRYLLWTMMFPWGYFYAGFAFIAWNWWLPPMQEMAQFKVGWIAQIWLRNAFFLTLIAGGLHWWLHMRRAQGTQYKYDRKWLAKRNKRFLWGDQVRDNIFWSIVSGITIVTAYEAITHWIYANDYALMPLISEHPAYLLAWVYGIFFWGTVHFYFVHRAMHFPRLYKIAHELHHRNINMGPWTGISMHPVEHLLYFSGFILFWIVPVHPFVIVLFSIYMAVSPAPSHSGFNYLVVGRFKIFTGDWFHQLHHQHFNLNYGNTTSPIDWLFGSWHDGSEGSLRDQRDKMRARA